MVYVLFNSKKIFGIYETISLLKVNCYIFIYQLFASEKLDEGTYTYIKEILLEEEDLNLEELITLMKEAKIYIQTQPVEESGETAFLYISDHIENRFRELQDKIAMDSRVTVKFPGRNAIDNMMITDEIEKEWKKIDPENYKTILNKLRKLIIKNIQKLQLDYSDRILFGNVSSDEASETSYQVWPSDIGNWNLPDGTKMFGEGFAICFDRQGPGVFGIVINPMYGYKI
tara:strand:- start:154 stop:840 length:687 start_codon:yes stop_codon:yes gene_type:complete